MEDVLLLLNDRETFIAETRSKLSIKCRTHLYRLLQDFNKLSTELEELNDTDDNDPDYTLDKEEETPRRVRFFIYIYTVAVG
jgi:hypothetical protein